MEENTSLRTFTRAYSADINLLTPTVLCLPVTCTPEQPPPCLELYVNVASRTNVSPQNDFP
eukprot:4858057-Amphidinium_carterae.1